MTTIIPAKRPKVVLTEGLGGNVTGLKWQAECHVEGCGWVYPCNGLEALKSDAEQQERWHRQDHRSAAVS